MSNDKGFVTKGTPEYFSEREQRLQSRINEAQSKIDQIEAKVRAELLEIGAERDRLRRHLEGRVMGLDLEQFRLTGVEAKRARPAPKQPKLPRHHHGEEFLRGPIPFRWLSKAAQLPGKALQTALVLWHQVQIRRGPVRPSHKQLGAFGVGRKAATRAYAELERAGLIATVRATGKNPTITILTHGGC